MYVLSSSQEILPVPFVHEHVRCLLFEEVAADRMENRTEEREEHVGIRESRSCREHERVIDHPLRCKIRLIRNEDNT